MLKRRKPGDPKEWAHVGTERARVSFYHAGAHVRFTSSSAERDPDNDKVLRGKRGNIRDQSDISRRRSAFSFGFASVDELRPVRWCAMSTLTFHHIPPREHVKETWAAFRRAWRARWGEPMDAWILEIQERGAPHWHVFHCRESIAGGQLGDAIDAGLVATYERDDGSERTVIRSNGARWIESAWLKASGQEWDEAAVAFTDGGLVEPLRSPDAAGRYIAKECAKRKQKELPAHYADGLGRWWFLAPRWRPQSWAHGEINLDAWPWEVPLSYVWKADDIAGCVDRLALDGKAVEHADAAKLAAETWSAPAPGTLPAPDALPASHATRIPQACGCGRNARWDAEIDAWTCPACRAIIVP